MDTIKSACPLNMTLWKFGAETDGSLILVISNLCEFMLTVRKRAPYRQTFGADTTQRQYIICNCCQTAITCLHKFALKCPLQILTVKHGTLNIQNDCQQWLLTALECTKFVFGSFWESLQRFPRNSSLLKGPTSKGEGRERERRRGNKGNGRDDALSLKHSWIRH